MGNNNYNNDDNDNMIKTDDSISQYELIFHFPVDNNDCINSIDIIDDKVVIGTMLGNAYLIRVDKNNLDVKEKKSKYFLNNKNNSDSERSNLISKESSRRRNKKSKIKLNKIDVFQNNLNNYANKKLNKREDEKEAQTKDITNDISKTKNSYKKIKMIRLNNKSEEKHHQDSNYSTKKRNIIKNIQIEEEEKKIEYNKMQDITKIDDDEEEEKEEKNNNETNIQDNTSNNKDKSQSKSNSEDNLRDKEKVLKFPQISKLIDRANENICCIQFDTEENLNIAVGDFEILRIEDIHRFNMNDPNTNLSYSKIQNYKATEMHFKYCENAICMMTETNHLIIFTNYVGFTSELIQEKYRYRNINLINQKLIAGRIPMFNFSIPFDFDGEDFLFLEYISKEERNICLFDTINNSYFYEYKIEQNFGHISHMKILNHKEKKIFLCRNDSQCEIHLLDDDFTCEESFEHIGNDIINIFIYFKESKLSYDFKRKIFEEKNKNGFNLNNNYDEYIKMNNNKSKSMIKIESDNSNSNRSKNNQKITLEKNKESNHNDNNILNMNGSNNNKKNKNTKEIKLQIREESVNSSMKDINSNTKDINLKNNTILIFNKNKSNEESKVPMNEDNILEKNNSKFKKNLLNIKTDDDKQITIDVEDKKEIINYYIFIMDSNGDVNMYKNKKNRTLFNLYNVGGVDESYKAKKFFSIGYPYYFVLNELYFAITTDFGLFVVSNKNKEL